MEFKKLQAITEKYIIIIDKLTNFSLTLSELQALNRERTKLEPLVNAYKEFNQLERDQINTQNLLNDSDISIRELARQELVTLNGKIQNTKNHLESLLVEDNPDDKKNIILEIRAGTGGNEACLFAGQLFDMYIRFAEKMAWKTEIISTSDGSKGGYKEIICSFVGNQVYSWMKFEAGVHRVQRVPDTETQGRIHTSACSVAILPEVEEIDMHIDSKDIRIDVFRAGGPGGQSVNTTDSAVRITHIPTGISVQCQDEKSQFKNKAKAMKVLLARISNAKQAMLDQERSEERKAMVKNGDRSDKIKTYNFPQDRCTDHRIGLTIYNLQKVFSGEIKDMLIQIRSNLRTKELSN